MNDQGPGKVVESHLVQPAAAPFPVAAHRVDNGCDDDAVDQVAGYLHAASHRAGNDRGCGCGENRLKEKVNLRVQVTRQRFRRRRGDAQTTKADESAQNGPAVHQAVADQEIEENTTRQVDDVLEHDVDSILGRVETRLDHGEAGLHKQHQHRRDEKEQVVNRIGNFIHTQRRRILGKCRWREDEKPKNGQGNRPQF